MNVNSINNANPNNNHNKAKKNVIKYSIAGIAGMGIGMLIPVAPIDASDVSHSHKSSGTKFRYNTLSAVNAKRLKPDYWGRGRNIILGALFAIGLTGLYDYFKSKSSKNKSEKA